jgi:hypothetical protein
VCVCVCVYVRCSAHAYARSYRCTISSLYHIICRRIYENTHACAHLRMHLHAHARTRTHGHMQRSRRTQTHVHVYARLHTMSARVRTVRVFIHTRMSRPSVHASLNLGVTARVSALPSFGLQVRGREEENDNVSFLGGE